MNQSIMDFLCLACERVTNFIGIFRNYDSLIALYSNSSIIIPNILPIALETCLTSDFVGFRVPVQLVMCFVAEHITLQSDLTVC